MQILSRILISVLLLAARSSQTSWNLTSSSYSTIHKTQNYLSKKSKLNIITRLVAKAATDFFDAYRFAYQSVN